MRSRTRLGDRHPPVDLQRRVVVDAPAVIEDAAVPVVGELVQAGVRHDDEVVADGSADAFKSDIEYAAGLGSARAAGILRGRDPEEHDAADAGVQ